jgi:hypothetical protein
MFWIKFNVLKKNPVEGEIFRTCPDRPWGPPSLLYNGYQVFPGVESGRDVTLILHLLLVPRSEKTVDYTSTLPVGFRDLQNQQLYQHACYSLDYE